jgi:AcrR family transcriptional regulator
MTMERANEPGTKRSRLGRRAASEGSPGAEEIAKVALDLFAERHFSLVTIRDIGRAAGVNSAMIYYYFKDKNELFRAAIDNAIQEAFLLFTRHREMGAYADANEAIRAWFDVHMILHRQLRNVIKIGIDCNCFKEALPDVMEPIRHFYVEERRILRDIFSRHESTKRLSDIESTALATLISTSLDGILTRSLLLDDFDMDETARDFERLISCFLMNR